MSLGRNIHPIKPRTHKALFNYYDGSKRRCLLACQKASKTRSLEIFTEEGHYKKDRLNIWKHFTRNRGITKLTVKIREFVFDKKKFKDLEKLILLYQNLISLYFDWYRDLSTFTVSSRLARPWIKSRMLKELHYMNQIDKLTNDDLAYLFGQVSRIPKLLDFSISCFMCRQLGRPEKLPVFPSGLTSIRIRIDGLSVFWEDCIHACLMKNQNLKTADLGCLSLNNALKSGSQCHSISLSAIKFIDLNELTFLLQDIPGVFERIRKLQIEYHKNFDTSTFSLAVPYLRNLVHLEMNFLEDQDVTESIIRALSCAPPKSLNTLIIFMDNGSLTPSIVTGLQRILKETNLEELQFYDFLISQEFSLLQIVINSCLDRRTRLRKLYLSYIGLQTDLFQGIRTQNLYFDSVKEIELLFDVKSPEDADLANQQLKNLVHILSCFKSLEAINFVFYYPVPNSFFLNLIPLFNSCPLRKFYVFFHNGISNFDQSAIESLVSCSLGIKTFQDLVIDIDFEEGPLDVLVPINMNHFKRFNSQLKRPQKLSISVSDGRKDHKYNSDKNYLVDLTKLYQF